MNTGSGRQGSDKTLYLKHFPIFIHIPARDSPHLNHLTVVRANGSETMKSIKSAIWHTAVCGAAGVLFGVAVYINFFHLLPQPLVKEASPELSAKIKDISDIEHLRKFALSQVSNERAIVKDFNSLLRYSVGFTIWCLIFAGVLFLINLGYLIRFLQEQRDEHIPRWLRWL